ncbi:ABC transporter permease [Morganella morganii]|uniref:ABC transporter permease n=1 Tax=Morganella morganii TaxID=582 RepID=UPI000D1ED939|nr:ABC transporter permease [Morganella morganii]QXO42517.1 ABC transporter permease [Morganella morganii]QXO46110.1 ABC transporter permease [Morganella morganii]QXO49831.1 ABC transporter permease [Morganella morganii]QXO53691.1 ABC transporter permease [Morganella morganii]QXO80326.1 ABC transporter permease [Morganella morganii]
MKLYFQTFLKVLLGMLEKPMWMLLIISLCVMSLVYVHPVLWDLPVAVVDQDNTVASRSLVRELDATAKVELHSYDNLAAARQDMIMRDLFVIIIIPQDFERNLLQGKNITVPVFGDGTNRIASGQIQQELSKAYQQILADYNTKILTANGYTPEQASILIAPIQSETVGMYNPGVSFAAIALPGLLVMLLQHTLLIACVRVSIAVRSTPKGKPPLAVYLGALSALLPIWLFLSTVFFALWPWVLGYRQEAPMYELWLLTFPFLLGVLGLGKLVTECLRSVEMIYLTLAFVTTPVFYMSGTIWPLQAMPDWVRFIASALPSTWATKAIAGINQMDLPFSGVQNDIMMMLVLGIIYTLLGVFIGMLRDGELRRITHSLRRLSRRKNKVR